jgi:glycosyltransferase involved in cell wall biosynthesis
MQLLSIVIPVYNEAATIALLLEKIKVADIPYITKELIIINDGSTDESGLLINEFIAQNIDLSITYLAHTSNTGKGSCLKQGIALANGQYILIQDADLEYDPNDYEKLLNPLLHKIADVVYGTRFLLGKPTNGIYFFHYWGNKLLTAFLNLFIPIKLTDMETGYKAFTASIAKQLQLIENRFGIEPEITAKLCSIPNIKIKEVPISFYGRTYKQGKKIKWKDGVKAIFCIIKYGLFKK